MTDLVEKVAETIWRTQFGDSPPRWGSVYTPQLDRERHIEMARAALSAIEDAGWVVVRKDETAAPDMAEALDDLLMAIELPGDHCELEPAKQRARAALAKARGTP